MSETAEFPLPADVTEEERAAARDGIAKYATIREETPRAIRFDGRVIGQTGPIWRFQYTRLYALEKGFLAAGHELREGIVVGYAETPEQLPECFLDPRVREFVEDELRFRKIIGGTSAPHA
ncbi:MAG: hypothetical protein ACR2G8_05530 [Candidatus Limnocylindria bacterium]|nr:hypothetical protein [Chloroflexota bacterium]MDQ3399887.1 hypothetical protein [Chloroflexota bacterium]